MSEPAITEILTEILTGLVIQPDFTISHPQQPDFSVDEAIVRRLQASDSDLQAKFSIRHLQSYLMGTYFSQVYRQPSDQSEIFANDEQMFVGKIRAANCGGGYYDPGWVVKSITSDSQFIVFKDGLSLKMPTPSLYTPEDDIQIGGPVSIAMPSNLMTIDRYVAIGNRGRLPQEPVANIYWNCDPQTAIELVASITQSLNQAAIPFELQVEPLLSSYHRVEPLILTVLCADYGKVEPILEQIYQLHPLQSITPAFTHRLAPGLAVAETASPEIDVADRCCRSIAIGIISYRKHPNIVMQVAAIERELIENSIIGSQAQPIQNLK